MSPSQRMIVARLFARTNVDKGLGDVLAEGIAAAVFDGDSGPLADLVRAEQSTMVNELQEIAAVKIPEG